MEEVAISPGLEYEKASSGWFSIVQLAMPLDPLKSFEVSVHRGP
jgi:hypothetical protein